MFSRGKTTAIYLHDGTRWRVVVTAHSRGRWSIRGSETASGSALRLPEELLAYADARHVRRMAVLMTAEIHSVAFKAPLDADPEELQTALRYETAQSLGADAEALRLAAINADFYSLGCDPDTWLLAAFQEDRLRYFERLALDRGLRFLGCGSFELAVLGWFRRHHSGDTRLLLVKETDAFYVAPGLDEIPFVTAALPVGNRPDPDPARDHDRRERAARRLAAHNRMPIGVMTCNDAAAPADALRMAELIPPATEQTTQTVAAILDDLASTVCNDLSRHADAICPLVGPTPPHRDPYRAGTWLFFAIVLTTMAGIATNWHTLASHEAALLARKQAWATLENARKNTQAKATALRKQRDTEIQRRNALLNTPVLPPGLMPTLETLATAMPPYTRLESLVHSDSPNGFEIRGHTRWQEGLADLLQNLNDALRPLNMVAQQDSIATSDGGRHELSFVYRIVPAETKFVPAETKP